MRAAARGHQIHGVFETRCQTKFLFVAGLVFLSLSALSWSFLWYLHRWDPQPQTYTRVNEHTLDGVVSWAIPGFPKVSQEMTVITQEASLTARDFQQNVSGLAKLHKTFGNGSMKAMQTRPDKDCNAPWEDLSVFDDEGFEGQGKMPANCSSTLPLPLLHIPQGGSYVKGVQELCNRNDQRISFFLVPDEILKVEEQGCSGDMSLSAVRQSWQVIGAESMRNLAANVLQSSDDNIRQSYKEIASNVRKGRPEVAVLWTSQEYAGGKFTEDTPGVAVLHNARFYPFGWAHDCRTFMAMTGKGCKPFDGVPAMCDRGQTPCLTGREHQKACMPGYEATHPELPKHPMVVSIAQQYGDAYFHFLAENLPRLMLVVPQLLADRSVLVHVYNKGTTFVRHALEMIGIPLERLIEGDGCARVLFVPEPIGCGSPSLGLLYATRRTVRHALGCPVRLPAEKPYMVLIRRHGTREVDNHDAVKDALDKELRALNVDVRVHEGNDPLRAQWDLFSRAEGAVGPHGAGLTNMIVMHKGSLIVEFIVMGAEINLCYLSMAVKLQHIYRAVEPLVSSQDGIIRVDAGTAASTTRAGLKYKFSQDAQASNVTAAASPVKR